MKDRKETPFGTLPLNLAAVGQALYGRSWRASLAEDLDTDEFAIVQMEIGHAPFPEDLRATLAGLAQNRAAAALAIAGDLALEAARIGREDELVAA